MQIVRRILVVLACTCWVFGSAHAQSPPPTEADRLFEEGRAFLADHKFAEACDRFQKSFDLDHATGTELNLAACHEELGHLRKAWELFTSAADEFERAGNAARTKFARDKADAVAAKLATVLVHVPQPMPTGFAVTIAGRVVQPRADIRELVEPGEVEITAAAPGRAGFDTKRQTVAGATLELEVPALAEQVVSTQREVVTERRRSRVHLAWVTGGVAVASAITAGAITLVANNHYSDTANGPHCTNNSAGLFCDSIGAKSIDDAKSLSNIATGFAIGAAVFAGVATYVYITAPRDQIVVAPTASTHGVGLELSGRF